MASGLLADLVEPTLRASGVPAGLGGTIPLAQEHLVRADELLRGAGGEGSKLDVCLVQTIHALDGWLNSSSITLVAAMARECQRHAHRLAWAHYHPQAAAAG